MMFITSYNPRQKKMITYGVHNKFELLPLFDNVRPT